MATRPALWGVLLLAGLAACYGGDDGQEWPRHVRADLASAGNGLGLHVRAPGADRYEFHEWRSEATFNELVRSFRDRPGAHVRFAPGEYEIEQRLTIHVVPGLRVSGSAMTRLVFPEGEDQVAVTTRPVGEGDQVLNVDDGSALLPGRRYQIYRPDGLDDRRLEFTVASIEGEQVTLVEPAAFMTHVDGIPAGSRIVEELNFFHILKSPDVVIEDLELDGRGRGGVRGHTTYCGIYVSGMHHGEGRPRVQGLHVRGCTFRDLDGRGIVFYGVSGAIIENNYFENIRAQAIEIDHISSGVIRGNHVNGAESGVMVNDAFESIVEGNTLTNCGAGVQFLAVYPHPWVNRGNIVRDNRIGPGCDVGVLFFGKGISDNLVTGNVFIDVPAASRVVGGAGNTIEQD